MAKDRWIFLVMGFLVLFSFSAIFLAGMFGFAEAYFRERSEKQGKKTLLPRKMFCVWRTLSIAFILSIIAAQVFFITLAWIPLGQWNLWATAGITIAIGTLTRVWAGKSVDDEIDPPKMLYWMASLILVFLVLLIVCFIALALSWSKLQTIFQAFL